MDVLSQVELDVHHVLQASNPALFCTRYGGPITFHLQVGKGEENLINSIRKTVNSFGGRYFKRYHEMTSYTVLLVTDLGFRSGMYNRPAICVTYVGDCVHTNFLRNINEYLHPWDNQERWKKIDLFEVIYSQNRMFLCSSQSALCKPYVPVSRKFITEDGTRQTPSVQNHIESLELLEVSSDDDDLFIKAGHDKRLATISEATTNVMLNPSVDVQAGLAFETEEETGVEPPSEQPALAKDSLEKTHNETAACSGYQSFPDDHRSTNGLSQQETLQPSKCISQKTVLHISESIIELEKLLHPQSSENAGRNDFDSQSKPTQKFAIIEKRSDKLREPENHQNYRVSKINPFVLLYRIPESIIHNETSIMSVVSGQENPKETTNVRSNPCANLQTGLSIETEDTGFKRPTDRLAIRNESIEKTHEESAACCEDQSCPDDHRSRSVNGLNLQEMPLSTRSINNQDILRPSRSQENVKRREVDPQLKKPLKVSTMFNKNKKCSYKLRGTKNHKDYCVTKRNPCRVPEDGQDKTSTLSVVSGSKNPKESSGNLNTPPTLSDNNKGQTLPKNGSGNLSPSTTHIKPDENVAGQLSARCTPIIVPPSKKHSTATIDGKPSGKKYLQFQITIKNSRKDRKTRKNKQRRRDSTGDEELVSDGEGSSISDVQSVPMEIPTLDITDESFLSSHQNAAEERISQLHGTGVSTSSLGLATPKHEIKEESELVKKRGRGYQDRYRRCEKVAILKWLVEHKKFRNLRGVLVWREMERKKIIPGRPYQSLKNQFLKNLVKKLDDYPFLTADQKRKLSGLDSESSSDEGFFYHGSCHNKFSKR